jgi:4-hydroxy-2-oxoheptanedioate aldolase
MIGLRNLVSGRPADRVPVRLLVAAGTAVALLVALASGLSGQQTYLHLNPAVEKLAAGKPIIGTQTDDLSLQNCHSLARLDMDYAYMEHGALNLDGLATCIAAMVDKAAALKKGNPQPNVALFARFPPYGRDIESNDWIVKQALDMGLMGIIFNGIDNREQALRVVRYMRYPQQKTSRYQQPPGLRGFSPGNALFAWGISSSEYEQRADVWPLNPEGDLLAIPMIGAIFIGAGADLHQWLGVPQNSPEVESARQAILAACKVHNLPCGITAIGKADVERRLREGWRMIRTGRGE